MPEGPASRARVRSLAIAALAATLLAGMLLRAAAGGGFLSSSLVYSAPRRQTAPGGGSPVEAARSFYLLLDRGEYGAAWGLAREPDFTGSGNAPYRSAVPAQAASQRGWTSREDFVSRLRDELGYRGEWLKIAEVQAEEIAGSAAAEAAGSAPPVAKTVAVVRAQGTLLGACTLYHWETVLPVTREGGGYRVLLPGTKQADALYYQEWFVNMRKIGTLRGTVP